VLSVAPVAVAGLLRLIQLPELKSEVYCNWYVPPASVLRVKFSEPLVSVTAWNSGTTVSRKTLPAKSFQSLENGLSFVGEAYIAAKAQ